MQMALGVSGNEPYEKTIKIFHQSYGISAWHVYRQSDGGFR